MLNVKKWGMLWNNTVNKKVLNVNPKAREKCEKDSKRIN